jgi:hypothetical protein
VGKINFCETQPTETECAEDEKEGRNSNEEWTCCACDSVCAALDAFEAGKDKARAAGTGHDEL